MVMLINKGELLNEQNVRYCISLVNEGNDDKLPAISSDCICITTSGKPVKPKTLGQKKYVDIINNAAATKMIKNIIPKLYILLFLMEIQLEQ